MENIDKQVAKALLKIKAIFFRVDKPFIWASGIKSPIYCDNRLTLSDPKIRTLIENGLVKNIKKHYPSVQVIAGTSTAGIPHAAIVGHLMKKPMIYVRSSSKDHGRKNQIEGKIKKGQRVVVIEDLISTGGSCIDVVNVLRKAGAKVLGVASIYTYGMAKSINRFKKEKVKNVSLTSFPTVAAVALKQKYIKKSDIKKLKKFVSNPSDESWIKGA